MQEHRTILLNIAKGDKNAFRELYNLYGKKVYNIALSYMQSEHEAEEVAQDVFTKIYKSAAKFRADASVNTWIYRITVNTSLNAIKKRKRLRIFSFGLEKVDAPSYEHPGILMENKENARLLFETIDTLSEKQRTAFILSYIEELPRQEVADIMETTLKSVESLLQRAKLNLRKKLVNRYPNRAK